MKNRKEYFKKYYLGHKEKYKQHRKYKEYPKIIQIDGEEWRDIKGYEGLYQVSNKGRVKSLCGDTRNKNSIRRELIMKPSAYSGYLNVCFCRNNVQSSKSVHRLVAETFIPNPENKPCVGHWDCDRSNNTVENLYWCTHEENNNHPITKLRNSVSNKGRIVSEKTRHLMSISHKGQKKSANSGTKKKKVLKLSLDGEILDIYECVKDASQKTGLSYQNIGDACRNKYSKHNTNVYNGFVWKYFTKKS